MVDLGPARGLTTGLVPTTIVNARDELSTYIRKLLEQVVHQRRVAEVADDLKILATQIQCLTIDLDLAVRLLGGTRPSSDRGKSKHGKGRWGSIDEAHFATDVPAALQHLGVIVAATWGSAGGMTMPSDLADLGWNDLAREVVGSLSHTNTAEFFKDFFQRLSLSAVHMRTRKSPSGSVELPDVDALAAETSEIHFKPVISEQNAEQAAREEAKKYCDAAIAGLKRPSNAVNSSQAAPAASNPAANTGPKPKKAPKGAASSTSATGTTTAPAPTPATAPAATAPTPAGSAGTTPRTAASFAPSPAPTSPWTPADGTISKFIDSKDHKGAVEYFDYLCKQAGLSAALPCAIDHMDLRGCHGAPGCRKCVKLDALVATGQPKTPVPAGVVDRVRAACDANTAAKIKP